MHKGYSSRFVHLSVCLSVYVSVTTLVATYLFYMSKVRWHTVSCGILKKYIVWILLKTFPSGDMALFACHDDRLFLDKKTHQWFLTRLQWGSI